jgi:hypothetical protein
MTTLLRTALALSTALAFVAPAQNGKPVRLAPGVRIRDQQNLIQLTGTLIDRKLVVNYTTDGMGLIREAWILTDEEARRQPWPRSVEESQRWQFDPTMQRWTKP